MRTVQMPESVVQVQTIADQCWASAWGIPGVAAGSKQSSGPQPPVPQRPLARQHPPWKTWLGGQVQHVAARPRLAQLARYEPCQEEIPRARAQKRFGRQSVRLFPPAPQEWGLGTVLTGPGDLKVEV